MKVLLTGAVGQLTRRVAATLVQHGHEVVGLDVRKPRSDGFPGPLERVKRYDHRGVAEVFRAHRPDALIHLGIRAGGYRAEQRQRYTQNVMGTRHLLDLSLRYELDRIVVMGTYHVYGAHPHNPTFLQEDAPLRAVQDFPQLLDAVELDHTVTSFLWRHERVLPTVLLRPVNVVGPSLHNQMSSLLRQGTVPRIIGFNPMLQFLHEQDMVRVVVLALQSGAAGVYNVAGDGAVPWATAIRNAGGRPLPLPLPIARPTMRILSRFGRSIPEHLMDFFRYPVIVSDEAIQHDLGWRPQVGVVETLRSVSYPAD